MIKSSRHSKIAGDFGEAFVLYWLSKHGYECARIDHTGIDLIASAPYRGEVLGISVKARTRTEGRETANIVLKTDAVESARRACRSFRCEAWFAFVVDAASMIRVVMMSADTLIELVPPAAKSLNVRTKPDWIDKYKRHSAVKWFEVKFEEHGGWASIQLPHGM